MVVHGAFCVHANAVGHRTCPCHLGWWFPGPSVTFARWSEVWGTWILQTWFLQKDFMLLNLSVEKGCSGIGWMSCASVSSSNFSSADKITQVFWKFWHFKLVSDLKLYHLCWGFTATQWSVSSSLTEKSWLDKTFPSRLEESWGWPLNPRGSCPFPGQQQQRGVHVPSQLPGSFP